MADATQYPESDPRHHTAQIKARLNEIITHLPGDVRKVDDPKAQALFETSREVLIGLVAAYEHFEGRTEEAWR